ncbi:MAG: hypothetical protein IJ243_08665 [Prevotella sp.]|nr:hypothetical protein [Prevotella sp.]
MQKISIKREQSPLDLWSLVPEGSQEAGLSFAERKQFSTAGQNQIITSPRPAFALIFNKNMAASSR